MALKWIFGVWPTGAISEANILPVVEGSDKTGVDVNSGDNATLSISKRGLTDLGYPNFNTILAEAYTMVALVDDAVAWNSPNAVLFAGWASKVSGEVGTSIEIQAVGPNEYSKLRNVANIANGSITAPNTKITYTANTWQGVLRSVVESLFTTPTGSPASAPNVLGTVSGSTAGSNLKVESFIYENIFYQDHLTSIRDEISPNGSEFRFIPRWASSAKNKIVWDCIIGTDTVGKIGYENTVNVPISTTSVFKSSSFGVTRNSDNLANRIIAISKQGDTEANSGTDYRVKTVANGLPLMDTWFNPSVELTEAEMTAQVNTRLEDLKTPKGTARYTVVGEISEWLPRVGSKLVFTGQTGTDAEGYSGTFRCTGIEFSASSKEIKVDIMLPQARYPKLPSDRNRDFGRNSPNIPERGVGFPVPSINSGGGLPPGGGSSPWVNPTPDNKDWAQVFPGAPTALTGGVTFAIKTDGTLWVQGRNDLGLFGNGSTSSEYSESFTQVGTRGGWETMLFPQSLNSASSVFFVRNDGTLWGWGNNTGGRLGIGTASPAQVLTPTQIGTAKDWKNFKYSFSQQGNYKHVIKSDGTLWAWGPNALGFLGTGNLNNVITPTQIGTETNWKRIRHVGQGAVALKEDGTLLGAGVRRLVGLGNSTAITSSFLPITVNSDDNWSYLTSNYFAFYARNNDKWYSWGGFSSNNSAPVAALNITGAQIINIPTEITINPPPYAGTTEPVEEIWVDYMDVTSLTSVYYFYTQYIWGAGYPTYMNTGVGTAFRTFQQVSNQYGFIAMNSFRYTYFKIFLQNDGTIHRLLANGSFIQIGTRAGITKEMLRGEYLIYKNSLFRYNAVLNTYNNVSTIFA